MHRSLAFALVALPLVARAEPLGVGEVLRRVAERSPEQAVAAGGIDVARADVLTARMLPNPTLLLTAAQSEPVFAASLAQRLPIFGQRGAEVRAAERGVELARAEAQLAVWRLRHDARIAYYNVARAEESLAIAQASEELARRIAQMAAERFDAGAGTRLDRDQGALVDVRALQEIADRRTMAAIARLELARLLGAPPEELGALADPLATIGATPPLEELLAQARARHPELRALVAERDAARARAIAARVERRPVPTLELGIELLNESTCNPKSASTTPNCIGPHVGLSFDLPVLNLNGGPIARAEAEAQLAELKLRAASLRVEIGVRGAYQALSAAVTRARFFEAEYLPKAISVERMAREGFAEGKNGLVQVIDAQRSVLEARLGLVETQFAIQSARADLEEASGVALPAP